MEGTKSGGPAKNTRKTKAAKLDLDGVDDNSSLKDDIKKTTTKKEKNTRAPRTPRTPKTPKTKTKSPIPQTPKSKNRAKSITQPKLHRKSTPKSKILFSETDIRSFLSKHGESTANTEETRVIKERKKQVSDGEEEESTATASFYSATSSLSGSTADISQEIVTFNGPTEGHLNSTFELESTIEWAGTPETTMSHISDTSITDVAEQTTEGNTHNANSTPKA